jgi:phage/plasmid-associated DNA primase
MIPVKNGILKFDYNQKKVECLPFSPEFKFSYRFDVTYDPNADGDEIRSLLSQFVSHEDLGYLYQIPAQGLLQMQGKVFKKAYFIQGEKNAGKTTYFQILYRLFGESSISKISLQQLTPECRFTIAALEGKIFNLYDDLSTIKLNTAGVFKTLTGDIFHQIERKNKDIYQGRITALHVFNCNRLPEIPDEVQTDNAFWERIEIVRFPNQFAVSPNFFKNTISDELISGYLNEIIDYMFKIHDNNGLIKKTDYLEVQNEWFKKDHFSRFIEDLFSNERTLKENYYLKDPFFSLYRHWCDQRDIPDRERIVTKNAFTDKLKLHGINPEQKRYSDDRKYVYSSHYPIRGEYNLIYSTLVDKMKNDNNESLDNFS